MSVFVGLLATAAVPQVAQAATAKSATALPGLTSTSGIGRGVSTPAGNSSNRPPTNGEAMPATPARTFDAAKSTPIPAETTATKRVYQNPDGSKTAFVTDGAARVSDGKGGWSDVNLTLSAGSDGRYRPAVSAAPVSIAAHGGGNLADLDTGQGTISVAAGAPAGSPQQPSMAAAQPNAAPSASNASIDNAPAKHRATFANGAGSGVDVQVAPIRDGVETTYVVPNSAVAAQPLYETLTIPAGWTARQAGGLIQLLDASGAISQLWVGGSADDSASPPADAEATLQLVSASGTTAVAQVVVRPTWLADAARVYPVMIDPTVVVYRTSDGAPAADTFIQGTYSTAQNTATTMHSGLVPGGSNGEKARALLLFNLGVPAGSVVSNAQLQMYETYAYFCSARPWYANPINGSWNAATITWANGGSTLATWPSQTGSASDAHGYSTSCPAAWTSWMNVTTAVQSWVNGEAVQGLQISGDETDIGGWKGFATAEYGLPPTLQVTYDSPPPVPAPGTPVTKSTVATTTPTLSVSPVVDQQGQHVQYWFRMSSTKDAESGNVVDSGWIDPTSWSPPASVLQDGATYYWHVYAWDGALFTKPTWANSLKVDLRLGDGGPSPTDSMGPVKVNLATGNAYVATGSHSIQTVGGSVGLSFQYNSQAPKAAGGLTGNYYTDTNANGLFDDPLVMQRNDPSLQFAWGAGSPSPQLPADNFLVRWTGFVSVPSTNNWTFGATHDDGVRITVNGSLVLDKWAGAGSGVEYGGSVYLNPNVAYPIQIDYREVTGGAAMGLYYSSGGLNYGVPGDWLSTAADPLPQGWGMSADLDGSLAYTKARITESSFVLVGADGSTTEYRRSADGKSWAPPVSADPSAPLPDNDATDVIGLATDGTYTVHGADGITYSFGADGTLRSASSALDDRNPAAPQYNWGGSPVRLNTITDPVSGQVTTLVYGGGVGQCPTTPPSGLTMAGSGQLCQVNYWDGTTTVLWYTTLTYNGVSHAQLARIVEPGNSAAGSADASPVTDFAYTATATGDQLTSVRDSLAADAVAAGMRADDTSVRTAITYTGTKVASVTLPAPTAAAARPQHSYAYLSATQSEVDDPALSPTPGKFRTVDFDAAARQIKETDATGRVMGTTTWDVPDRPLIKTDAAGRMTTYVYDSFNRLVSTYGPSPSNCFSFNVPNGTCTTPVPDHTTTNYDQSFHTLAATYWSNKSLAGAPKLHATGVGDPTGKILVTWGSGSPSGLGVTENWSARFTGRVLLPSSGTYKFDAISDDGVRIYIDDQLVSELWTDHAATASTWVSDFANTNANTWHRIRIDYYNATNPGNLWPSLDLQWTPPSGGTVDVPGADLTPEYNLTSSVIRDDVPASGSPAQATSTDYAAPENGLATLVTQDPGTSPHLNLGTATAYETPGSGYLRKVSQTLPGNTTTTYQYYGPNDPAPSNTCSAADLQHGLLHTTTGPDPDGAGSQTSRVDEVVYDKSGRPVATRISGGSWTCLTYDQRGRVVTKSVPAFGGEAAYTASSDYAVGGNPFVSTVTDTSLPALNQTVSTTVDLLGRVVDYTDNWGKRTTTTYDAAGRVTDQAGPVGTSETMHTDYDNAGRPTSQKVDGLVVATPSYDGGAGPTGSGELTSVSYPSGTGNGGNGTSGTFTRNGAGQGDSVNWKQGATQLAKNNVTYSQTGRVVTDAYAGISYTNTYDGVGRLTGATRPGGHSYGYTYAPTGGCGFNTTAGANTNRTSYSDTVGTNTIGASSCYDAADKLTSTIGDPRSDGTISYDAHGNTTLLGGQAMTYDGGDRHLSTTMGSTTVRYQRDGTDRIVSRVATSPAPSVVAAHGTSTAATGTAGATSVAVTTPAAAVTGDVVVAQVVVSGGSGTIVTPPTGWTSLNSSSNSTIVQEGLYWHTLAAGETTFTFSFGSTQDAVVALAAYAGVATPVAPLVSTPYLNTNTTTHTANSVVTTAANSRLLQFVGAKSATTVVDQTQQAAPRTETYDVASGNSTPANRVEAAIFEEGAPMAGPTSARAVTSTVSTTSVSHLVALTPAVGSTTTTTTRYGFSGSGDSSDYVLDASNNLTQHDVGLLGGVTITKDVITPANDVWSYPNIHGDVIMTTNNAGAWSGVTNFYDPFGQALSTIPDNAKGNFDYGWLGSKQRGLEHEGALNIIEMGARQYAPTLGRFLGVDPVEGGSANDYDYVAGDPVNSLDLAGTCKHHGGILGGLRDAGCHTGNVITKNRVAKKLGRIATSGDFWLAVGGLAGSIMVGVAFAAFVAGTGGGGLLVAGLALRTGTGALSIIRAGRKYRKGASRGSTYRSMSESLIGMFTTTFAPTSQVGNIFGAYQVGEAAWAA